MSAALSDGLSDGDTEALIAERRYEIISKIVSEVVREKRREWTKTDLFDHVFLHKVLGIPIFLALLWAVFQFTFTFSEPFMVMIEIFFGWLGTVAAQNIENEMIASFVSDGVCNGLGSVLVFVPPIFSLFFALAVLEDSGYLARAAFVMDRLMYRMGLHGRSFIPLMCGFGCNIPGIMATRSIESEKDRMITILVNPLMSCGARLPVYVLISGVIFGGGYAAGTAIFCIYVLGIALAVIMALIFRRTIFRGKPSAFVLELPRYIMPTVRSTLIHTWERGKYFLMKAGTIIFGVMIVVWFLTVMPWDATNGGEIIEKSLIAQFGKVIEPVFRPFGWDWMAAVALFFGFLAKEVVVGTYGLLLGGGEEEEAVKDALVSAGVFTPLTGFAFMAFTLIYVPCVAAVATIYRETNSLKWTIFAVAYLVALAFIVAAIIIGIGHLLGFS